MQGSHRPHCRRILSCFRKIPPNDCTVASLWSDCAERDRLEARAGGPTARHPNEQPAFLSTQLTPLERG